MIETEYRNALRQHLTQKGIQTGIHYPIPIHLQEAYSDLRLAPGAFPVSEQVARRTLSLPMYPELTPAQIEFTVGTIREFFASFGTSKERR